MLDLGFGFESLGFKELIKDLFSRSCYFFDTFRRGQPA